MESDLDGALAEMRTLKERIKEIGKASVVRATKALLDGHPEVEAIRWCQYTPYFNDGDACVFSVREPEVKLAGADGGGDNGDGYFGAWELSYYAEKKQVTPPAGLSEELKAFAKLLGEARDAMKAAFGDHVQVTIRRGSDKAEVDDYEHK